jgi:hypothetical protein
VLFGAAVAVIAFALVIGHYTLPALGEVSSTDLFFSVTREVGGTLPDVKPCRARRRGTWYCPISDKGVSGVAGYAVSLKGDCWTARKVTSHEEGPPLPQRAAGCVRFRDQRAGSW